MAYLTQLEDLPNEVIYEIFQYIELFQLFNTFNNLNIRFQNLLTSSTFPLEINDFCVSKSTFDYCWKQIIRPKHYRVQSLHLSNPLIMDQILLSNSTVAQFTHLEKLTIVNVDVLHIEKVLIHLSSLPRLFSLTILPRHRYYYRLTLQYLHIFRLPVLKYCKLSFHEQWGPHDIPVATNGVSPIEHLVLVGIGRLDDLHAFLSHIQHLKYLSIDYRNGAFGHFRSNQPLTQLTHRLTHVSLNFPKFSFDSMQRMIQYLCKHVQVLHITCQNIWGHLNFNEWERLILNHMPYLRIFDISITRRSYDSIRTPTVLCHVIFDSLFWFEREWFVECSYTRGKKRPIFLKLSTIDPYRRKQYTLIEETINQTDANNEKAILKTVHEIDICNTQSLKSCMKYFPNATELIISCSLVNEHTNFLSANLNRILPLNNLSKLVIRFNRDTLSKVFDLLQYSPNIQTLEVLNSTSVQRPESFQLVSRDNNIRDLTVHYEHKIEETKRWVHLCPRLQRFTFPKPSDGYKVFIRSLLMNDNEQANDLSFLCITNILPHQSDLLKSFVESANLFRTDSLQMKYGQKTDNICFWW